MKILFLDPIHKVWEFFRGLTANPGLIYLAAVARRDYNVKVFDAYAENDQPWNKTAEYLERERPDVVFISGSFTTFWYDAMNCAKLVREILPGAKIVTGGYTATQLYNQALESGLFDFVICGEGEITMMELLAAIRSGSGYCGIDGLAYYEDARVKKNQDREQIKDLDSLPIPAFDLFPMHRYYLAPFGGSIGYTVSFNRGCQNRCKFCSETLLWNHQWRGHSAEYMYEVLSILCNKYKKHVFYVGDDDFLHDRKRVENFIELMSKKPLDAKFWIQTTCYNTIANADLLSDLKRIGVFQYMMGIETPKPSSLKALNKPQDFDTVNKALDLLRPHNFIIMGMLMWGAPWDTMADLDAALEYLGSHCDIIGPNATTPWPGTPYYEECEKLGAIEVRDLSLYDMTNCITRTAELSAEEADYHYKRTVGRFLMTNKKFLGNYLFSNKPLYRSTVHMLMKMGWRFFMMKPWVQKNYQEFNDFFSEFMTRKNARYSLKIESAVKK